MTANHDDFRIAAHGSDPLSGAAHNDIRALLEQDHSEEMLAAAMAAVANQIGRIHPDMGNPHMDDAIYNGIEEQFEAWWDLERELVTRICNILICENPEKGIPIEWSYRDIIRPFMERNGYFDNDGLWSKEAIVADEFHIGKYTILVLDQNVPTKKHDTYQIDGIAYTPVHFHILPRSTEPIRNHIAIESADSFLKRAVRFELKNNIQTEVEDDG